MSNNVNKMLNKFCYLKYLFQNEDIFLTDPHYVILKKNITLHLN